MRILHLIATLNRESGGPAQACVEMAAAVARRGHDVSIYTTNWKEGGVEDVPTDRPVERDGFAVRYFPVHAPRFWKPSLAMARALSRDMAGFDVVHLHSIYLFHDLVGGHYARRRGVPYIVRPHGMLDPYIRAHHRARKWLMEAAFQNRVLRHATAIHYTSDIEREISTPFAMGAPPRVVPLGVDLSGFDALPSPEIFHQRFPETRGKTIVLFLSRLHFKKGLDLLLPAFAQLAATDPTLHLVIAGPDDGMLGQCREWAARDGVAGRVTFTGMLRGADKLSAFAAARLFALPSYSENFGIAAVEAMAAGLPVVVSDQVNIWRELKAGGGATVIACTRDALTTAMTPLLADAGAASEAGRRARATVDRLYRWDNVAAALETLYREAADSRIVSRTSGAAA
ncbi:MAG: glycosyltransferase [Alphaproteobacteria bacterium]|nr:glycosyltransferase [Alphaproteobacteria bacterium]MCW5739307.1 glycosyltransferase [Alphaproteobacteria bacterium]